MKLTLARDALADTLSRVERIVEKRNTIPILSNLFLTATPGFLVMRGTDLDIEATSRCAASVQTPGTCTIAAHVLADIIRKLPKGGEVGLAQEQPEGPVTIRAGRARFQLQTLPPENFPDLVVKDLRHEFRLSVADFLALLKRPQFVISTEETRYYLNGVFLHATTVDGAPVLRSAATDGHRLARVTIPAPVFVQGGPADMPGVIVPRKMVAHATRLAEGQTGDVTIALNTDRLRVTYPDEVTQIMSKMIDGQFPDYARVIPQGNGLKFRVDRERLGPAVDLVMSVASERGRAVKFSFAKDLLKLSVTNPDGGDATDEIEATGNGLCDIGFNGRYALDMLGEMNGDQIEIALADAGSPSIWTDPSDPNWLAVLMPMRV